MRVVLIGGSGFIGRRVVAALSRRGATLAVVCRTAPDPDVAGAVHWIEADRRSLRTARRELGRFAPEVAVDLISYSEADASETRAALAGLVKRCVVASSGDVYLAYGRLTGKEPGAVEPVPLAESAPLRTRPYPYRGERPRSATDPSRWMDDYEKVHVESAFRAASQFETCVVRLPMVYGPRDRQHRFAAPMLRMLSGRPAVLLEAATAAWRSSFSFVDNVAEAIALAATAPAVAATYNVSEPDAPTQLDWTRAIARELDWKGEVRVIRDDDLPGHLSALSRAYDLRQGLVMSSARLRTELGFREVVGRGTALRRTLDWERSLPDAHARLDVLALEAEDRYLASGGASGGATMAAPGE